MNSHVELKCLNMILKISKMSENHKFSSFSNFRVSIETRVVGVFRRVAVPKRYVYLLQTASSRLFLKNQE